MAAPIYQVIYDDLTGQIASGTLAPEDRIPSEAELAARYGVSRMTVRQALKRLQDDRLVMRRRGAGTFVTSTSSRFRSLNRLGPFEQELGLDGSRVCTQVLRRETVVPPREVQQRLMLKPRQEAIVLTRLRTVDRRPAALQRSWIPYAVAPGLAREDLIEGSLYRTLVERYGIAVQWAEQEISAVLADKECAEALQVTIGSPLTANKRLTYATTPTPVELAYGWTRPEFPVLIRLEA